MPTNTAASAFITVFLANAPLTAAPSTTVGPRPLKAVGSSSTSANATSLASDTSVESVGCDTVTSVAATEPARALDTLISEILAMEEPRVSPTMREIAEEIASAGVDALDDSWANHLAASLID